MATATRTRIKAKVATKTATKVRHRTVAKAKPDAIDTIQKALVVIASLVIAGFLYAGNWAGAGLCLFSVMVFAGSYQVLRRK